MPPSQQCMFRLHPVVASIASAFLLGIGGWMIHSTRTTSERVAVLEYESREKQRQLQRIEDKLDRLIEQRR